VTAVVALSRPRHTWAAVFAGTFVLLLLIHHKTFSSLIRGWDDDPFRHGYFVIPLFAWLTARMRHRLLTCEPRPTFVAVPFVALLSFAWAVGNVTAKSTLQEASVAGLVIALAWAVSGTAVVRALAFPLGVIWFALPWGHLLAPALQDITARIVSKLLTLGGLNAVLEGHVISLGDTRWLVAEGCGGINYFVASTAVGYVYAGAVYREWRHRLGMLVGSACVPLAGNIARVYTTILAGYLGATRIVDGMEHYVYGVIVFTFMLAMLLITCGNWREDGVATDDLPHTPAEPASTGPPPLRTLLCGMLSLLLVAAGPLGVHVARSEAGPQRHLEPHQPAPRQLRNGTDSWTIKHRSDLVSQSDSPCCAAVHPRRPLPSDSGCGAERCDWKRVSVTVQNN
jgi:exosortase